MFSKVGNCSCFTRDWLIKYVCIVEERGGYNNISSNGRGGSGSEINWRGGRVKEVAGEGAGDHGITYV